MFCVPACVCARELWSECTYIRVGMTVAALYPLIFIPDCLMHSHASLSARTRTLNVCPCLLHLCTVCFVFPISLPPTPLSSLPHSPKDWHEAWCWNSLLLSSTPCLSGDVQWSLLLQQWQPKFRRGSGYWIANLFICCSVWMRVYIIVFIPTTTWAFHVCSWMYV